MCDRSDNTSLRSINKVDTNDASATSIREWDNETKHYFCNIMLNDDDDTKESHLVTTTTSTTTTSDDVTSFMSRNKGYEGGNQKNFDDDHGSGIHNLQYDISTDRHPTIEKDTAWYSTSRQQIVQRLNKLDDAMKQTIYGSTMHTNLYQSILDPRNIHSSNYNDQPIFTTEYNNHQRTIPVPTFTPPYDVERASYSSHQHDVPQKRKSLSCPTFTNAPAQPNPTYGDTDVLNQSWSGSSYNMELYQHRLHKEHLLNSFRSGIVRNDHKTYTEIMSPKECDVSDIEPTPFHPFHHHEKIQPIDQSKTVMDASNSVKKKQIKKTTKVLQSKSSIKDKVSEHRQRCSTGSSRINNYLMPRNEVTKVTSSTKCTSPITLSAFSLLQDLGQPPWQQHNQIKLLLKPLTPYNYFYRDERGNLVDNMINQDDTMPPSGIDFSETKLRSLLYQHWYVDPLKKKRDHRKTHGKLSFETLSKVIAERWRALSDDGREFYRRVSKCDEQYYLSQRRIYENNILVTDSDK